ncbi:MAG: DUF1501 domain-containing protein, partial [Planctomycetales bacterium]|nr:DUF1501 domain-containing protein [Planctomycetales bacterium]
MSASHLCGTRHQQHAFMSLGAHAREGLCVVSRRNLLKLGLQGMAGLTLPGLLRERSRAAAAGQTVPGNRAVILLWMTGGPSHIDIWDMKPDRPLVNRGPFRPIQTAVPGEFICEHLPKQAAMLDKFTIVRSVDCRHSNHEPNRVMQTGHRAAAPRVNPIGDKYPAIGSVVAKYRGANQPGMPPYVVFQKSRSHIADGGYLGRQHDPFQANLAAKLPVYDLVGKDTGQVTRAEMFQFAPQLSLERMQERQGLLREFNRLHHALDRSHEVQALDRYQQQAVETITGGRVRDAFDLTLERSQMCERYGKHLWCQQALLARRLVEAGSSFVTIDLSY